MNRILLFAIFLMASKSLIGQYDANRHFKIVIVNQNNTPIKKCKLYKNYGSQNDYIDKSDNSGTISFENNCKGFEQFWIYPPGEYYPRYVDCPIEIDTIEIITKEGYENLVFNGTKLKTNEIKDSLLLTSALAKYKLATYELNSNLRYDSLVTETYNIFGMYLNVIEQESDSIKINYANSEFYIPNSIKSAIKTVQIQCGLPATGLINEDLINTLSNDNLDIIYNKKIMNF